MRVCNLGVDSGQMSIVPFGGAVDLTKYNHIDGIFELIKAAPGARVCVSVEYNDQGRVARLFAKVGRFSKSGNRVGSFEASNSGKVVIADPCYILSGDFYGFNEEAPKPGYEAACQSTNNEHGAGMFDTGDGMGACSSTGYGDGCYPLRVRLDSNGNFTDLSIDFVEEENYDDDEENRYEV